VDLDLVGLLMQLLVVITLLALTNVTAILAITSISDTVKVSGSGSIVIYDSNFLHPKYNFRSVLPPPCCRYTLCDVKVITQLEFLSCLLNAALGTTKMTQKHSPHPIVLLPFSSVRHFVSV